MISRTSLSGKSAPSVRASLVALVIGCVLPITIVAAVLVFGFNEYDQGQLDLAAISRTRAMTANVDREFANIQASLLALSTSSQLQTGDLAAFHAQALDALRDMHAESIVLLDTTGQLLLTTRRSFGVPLPRLSNPPILKRTLATGKPTISDLFIGPVAGGLIVTVAVPVRRDGVIVYSLNATVAPSELLRVLHDQRMPANWIAVIVDGRGRIAARTNEMKRFLGKSVSDRLKEQMAHSNESSFESKTLEGIAVKTAFSRSSVTGWTVAVGIPLEEIAAGLHRTLLWLSLASAFALGAGLLFARYVGGRIARSISALTAPALALATGAMAPLPRLYVKEAYEVGVALQDAAVALDLATHKSHHDGLTGLGNRTLFQIIVDQQFALCHRNTGEFAILYLDLDGFKSVNDTHGHAVGDLLLCAVADRIRATIRDSDFAARLGGDEFAISLAQSDLAHASALAERLIFAISAPYAFAGITATVSVSIGIAAYAESVADCDALLRAADCAMYAAKAAGKRQWKATGR